MKVYIKTPARLHLGLIDLGGEFGRIFGSVGLAIDKPSVVLEAHPSKKPRVSGLRRGEVEARVKSFAEFYHVTGNVNIDVKEAIPKHVGLGSGTQLALAVGTALAKLFKVEASVRQLATMAGKGSVSGIGTAVFEHGGFVVDAGHKIKRDEPRLCASRPPPPIIFHRSFPEDWFFVVAVPNVKRGFTDEEEVRAFDRLPPMTPENVGKVCRLVLVRLLPALVERDIEVFGEALTELQGTVGDYFKRAQGGRFSSSISRECTEYMTRLGAYGVGQSSWGPTVYGLVRGDKKGEELVRAVRSFLSERAGGCVFHAGANNEGAQVRVVEH